MGWGINSILGYIPWAINQVVSTTVSMKGQDHKFFGEMTDGLNDELIQFHHFADEEIEVQSKSKAAQEPS